MISVIIPSWSHARLARTLGHLNQTRKGDVDYCFWLDEGGRTLAVEGMAIGGKKAKGDILMFLHDDVDVLEPGWDAQVEAKFKGKKVGLAGFCGALGLGTDELYRKPYKLQQLARICFMSNATDWESHGYQLKRPRKVSVLDGLCQIFRREAYEEMGGWQDCLDAGISFHMYDAWAACRMAELGWETWALPVSYKHHGGLTSTSKEYDSWLRKKGIAGDLEIHQKAHVVIYERFKNVLPLAV